MKRLSIHKTLTGVVLGILLAPQSVLAQTAELNGANTAWILTSTALVLFMTLPGLALFYAGLVRTKNVLSVLMQCFAIACLISIAWMVFAYALAFGDGGALQKFVGFSKFFMSGIRLDSMVGDIPETVFFMFQMTFAIITPALFVGGFAERMKFSAVLWFSILWLAFVYAPVCHWVWGGGWLADMGFKDFAGGAVVHINAGVAAILAAIMIGKRKGFPETLMPPHNMTLTVIGAAMLWVGWFGFNAGSALAANGSAGMAMTVTHLSAAAGSLAWMALEWIKYGKPSVLGIVTGMVAGLATITPASGYVGPVGALVIGTTAGIVCYFATQYVKRTLKIDDSLDVFTVHGAGGIMGLLMTAIFAAESMGGMGLSVSIGSQFVTQLVGVIATIVWCGAISYILLKALDAIIGLRVSAEEETEGLDLVLHDERGYNF
ncbi:MAG: ammonia channel protein [Gammaproteobacteria bacterium RIFCSPLOWO2_12_FULL_52_10]|nr:MAG: ammonia channel protein [Gammaproteobacteria bacterium RIFCSPLOWO2_12_FULL_52_10]